MTYLCALKKRQETILRYDQNFFFLLLYSVYYIKALPGYLVRSSWLLRLDSLRRSREKIGVQDASQQIILASALVWDMEE